MAPIAEIVLIEGVPVAFSEKTGAFFALPTDRLYWTKEAQGPTDKLLFAILAVKRVPITLWPMGDMTPLTAYELQRRGVLQSADGRRYGGLRE